MMNAMQGFDMIHSGLVAGLGSLGGAQDEWRLQRSHTAAVQGYNALAGRYNELLEASEIVTGRLQTALMRERAENARLRSLLSKSR